METQSKQVQNIMQQKHKKKRQNYEKQLKTSKKREKNLKTNKKQ